MSVLAPLSSVFSELKLSLPTLTLQEQEDFLTLVDDSPFPIEDWARAWGALAQHLESRASTLEIPHQIHYLSCAAEGAAPGGKPYTTLHAAVEEYLEAEGVALAQKKAAP